MKNMGDVKYENRSPSIRLQTEIYDLGWCLQKN